MKLFLGNFYGHLAIFSGHTARHGVFAAKVGEEPALMVSFHPYLCQLRLELGTYLTYRMMICSRYDITPITLN